MRVRLEDDILFVYGINLPYHAFASQMVVEAGLANSCDSNNEVGAFFGSVEHSSSFLKKLEYLVCSFLHE